MSIVTREIGYDEWQAEAERTSFLPLQQHWGYGQTMADFGARTTRLAIEQNDQLIGVAQLLHRRIAKLMPLTLCLRGPVWLSDVSTEQKADAYQALRRRHRRALWMPEAADDAEALTAAGTKQVMTGYHTVLLDLSQQLDVLRANLDGKWRNRLVASEKEAFSIERLESPTDYRFLVQHEAAQRQRRRYTALPPAFAAQYQLQLGDKAVYAIAAMHKREPIAAMLCLIHGRSATYQLGWSGEEGKAKSAHNALLWRTIKELKARGIGWLDLGGIATDESPGLARFKLGTGGNVHSLPGTYF